MKVLRKIIHIDEDKCDGCGACVPACAEGAIRILGGKARLVSEAACDGLGACLGDCPRGALSVAEAEADAFDEAAAPPPADPAPAPAGEVLPCGCPSQHIQTFSPGEARPGAKEERTRSRLTHWPVQIRLVPPAAPFLQNAHLLVSADCAVLAAPNFHAEHLAGRVVLMGCPKFDETNASVEKFTRIFQANAIRSVTVLVMHVPCCQGLPSLVRTAMEAAGKSIPLLKAVLDAQGNVIRTEAG